MTAKWNLKMLHDVKNTVANKNEILELLDEELRCSNEALNAQLTFNASLVRDLDNAVIQMQMNFLEGRI